MPEGVAFFFFGADAGGLDEVAVVIGLVGGVVAVAACAEDLSWREVGEGSVSEAGLPGQGRGCGEPGSNA